MEIETSLPPFLQRVESFLDNLHQSRTIYNQARERNRVSKLAISNSLNSLQEAHTEMMSSSRSAMVAIRFNIVNWLNYFGASIPTDEDSDEPPVMIGNQMHSLISCLCRVLQLYIRAIEAAVTSLDHCDAAQEATGHVVLQTRLKSLMQSYARFMEVSVESMKIINLLMTWPLPQMGLAHRMGLAVPPQAECEAAQEAAREAVRHLLAATTTKAVPEEGPVVPEESEEDDNAAAEGHNTVAPKETKENDRTVPGESEEKVE